MSHLAIQICRWTFSGILTLGAVVAVSIVLAGLLKDASSPLAAAAPGTAVSDVDSKYRKMCIAAECHPVDIRGHMPKHSPYLEGQCLTCHNDHATSSPDLLRFTDNTPCLKCHANIEMAGAGSTVKHPPDTQRCLDCHAPHQSWHRNMVRGPEQLRACSECHKEFMEQSQKQPFRHRHFDNQVQCGLCHYAHRRSAEHYVRENVDETCMTCHSLPIRLEGRVISDIKTQVRTFPSVHKPVAEHKCAACHTPHGSPMPSLLNSGYPAGNYDAYTREQYQLCFQCHKPELVETRWTEDATGFRHGDRNLHQWHVVRMRRGRACHLCHAAHASEKPHLMRPRITFREWTTELGYDPTANGGSCNTPCHEVKNYDRAARRTRPAVE